MNIRRNITKKLKNALSRAPVVVLTGARQTGKTTLAQELKPDYTYVTFDSLGILSSAQSDPHGFIDTLEKPVIIDEAQRAPELFYAIKKSVDENRKPGTFLLTGSTNPLFIPRIGDALVGRVEILELQPFSQGELLGKTEHFIDALYHDTLKPLRYESLTKKELFQKIVTGGYPLVQNINDEARRAWFDSYITTLLYRDVQELSQISRLAEFPQLLRVLATCVGTFANIADMGRVLGLPATTLHRYTTLLEALFLLQLQPPWFRNLGKRLVKAPKIYLNDTGLLAFLLAASPEKMMANTVPTGAMLENFVVNELQRQRTWNTVPSKLYHFRTATGVEVDIVIEYDDGRCVGIEVKASDTVNKNDFKGLEYFQELLGPQCIRCVVLYTGNTPLSFGKNMHALPISALWSY